MLSTDAEFECGVMTDLLWTFDRVSVGGSPMPRLDDVSLVIEPGVTAVIGHSGAGKTSLLNLLVGYERPDAGRLTPGDRMRVDDARRLPVFWVPQDDGLWPRVSVQRHLELVTPAASSGIAGQTGNAGEWIDAFDLGRVATATPERLSRGEASRLAVARALAAHAEVLVLDEPLAHVDPARRWRYWERLIEGATAAGTSLVFATHEPDDVLRYAEHAIGLQNGRVLFVGSTKTLYESPPSEAAALLLGPVNWISPDEQRRWNIDRDIDKTNGTDCLRPERLAIEPQTDGPATVIASRAGGAFTDSLLRHNTTGQECRFRHRSPRERLSPGVRVRLTVVSLLMTLVLGGCLPAAGGPPLKVASEQSFALPADGSLIPQPRDVAIGHGGEKIVLDNAGRVLVYNAQGELDRLWDMPDSSVGNPEGACVLADGRIVVADTHYHQVVIFDRQGNVVEIIGELGRGPGQFIYPVGVTTDPDGNLYVAEYGGNDRIQKFDRNGRLLTRFGSFGTDTGQFQRPSGIVWLDGKIYAVDAFNNRALIFTDSGDYLGLLGTPEVGLHYPYDMSLGPDGRLYIIEYGAGRLTVLTIDGTPVARYGTTGGSRGQLRTPWGLAVDDAGRIWIADTGNRRIVELVPAQAEAAVTFPAAPETQTGIGGAP